MSKSDPGVVRVLYGVCEPACGYGYAVSVVGLPYREPPRPPTPAPQPARALPPRDIYPAGWLQRAHMPEGTQEIQRSEEHTSELQSPVHVLCRPLLIKNK